MSEVARLVTSLPSSVSQLVILCPVANHLGTGHPNLNLTAEEKRVYGQLFRSADPEGFEVVSGDVAVKFFEKTKLPPEILGQVCTLGDSIGCRD